MKRARRYGHLDKSHKSIVKELINEHFWVGETSASAGFVDLVVSDKSDGTTALAEVKETGGNIYLSQLYTIATFPGNVCFFTSPQQAVETMRNKRFLTPIQKEKILQFYYRFMLKTKSKAKNPLVAVSTFEKEVKL